MQEMWQCPVAIGNRSFHSRETSLGFQVRLYSSPKTHGHATTQGKAIQKLFKLRRLSGVELSSPSLRKAWQIQIKWNPAEGTSGPPENVWHLREKERLEQINIVVGGGTNGREEPAILESSTCKQTSILAQKRGGVEMSCYQGSLQFSILHCLGGERHRRLSLAFGSKTT